MLSKRDLQVLLDDVKKEFSIKSTYSSTGPGYLDPWLLMQKRKNIWQHIEPVQSAPSRKIIFCEPFAGQVVTQPFALAFVAALVEHYEVYLWPGAKSPMQAVRPIAAPEEFWELKPQAVAATQAEVHDSLAYQGLNTAQYIVIDHHAYGAIIDRWHEKFLEHEYFKLLETKKLHKHDSFTLDVRSIPIANISDIAKHVVRDDIKTIITYPISQPEIETFMSLFGKLECLVIKHATANWVSQTLHTNYGLRIELRKFRSDKHYQLPANIDIDSLTITSCKYQRMQSFSVQPGARVGKLILKNFSHTGHLQVNLSHLTMLTELTFTECYVEKLTIDRDNEITTLNIIGGFLEPFKFSQLTALKFLKLVNSNTEFLKIGNSNALLDALSSIGLDFREDVPQLEKIELITDGSESYLRSKSGRTHLNLSRDADLREISAINLDQWDITLPPHDVVTRNVMPEKQKKLARRPSFEAWSMTDVINDIEECKDKNLKSMRDSRRDYDILKTSTLELSEYPEIEYLHYEHNMPSAEKIVRSHPKLKEFKLYDFHSFNSLGFDFSGKINLQSIFIRAAASKQTTVNLQGCHHLLNLSIHVGTNPLTLLNLRDCTALRALYIRSNNADILKEMALFEVPKQCEIYIFKDTPAELWSNRISHAMSSVCNRLPSLPNCCPTCGTSRGDADSGSGCACSKPAVIITFSILGAAVIGMSIYIVYCLISGLRPFGGSGGDNEPTLAPPPNNQTSGPMPPAESPGLPDVAKILMAAGSGALLLLLCGGLLAYRYREKLRERFRRNKPEKYDASIYGAATVDGETMLFERDIKFNERFNFNFYTGRKIDFNHVRLHVQNAMKWRDRKLYFYTDLSGKRMVNVPEQLLDTNTRLQVRELMSEMHNKQDEALAYIAGEILPGEMYPLPTLESVESEEDLLGVYSEQAGLVNIYYLPSAQQLYFGLKDRSENAKPATVTIYYHLRRNLNYLNIPYLKNSQGVEHIQDGAAVQVENVSDLLPPEVIDYAWKRLANVPELRFMVSRQLSIPQKLNLLIDYFRSATYDYLEPNPSNHIKLLFEIIGQNKGVCRHCSMGFFTMARLLGVPVVINSNRGYRKIGHRFCAIPFVTEDGIRYQRVDLTLPDNSLEYSDDDLNLFRDILELLSKQHLAPEILVMDDDSETMKATYQAYYNNFQSAVSVAQLRSIRPILERRQGPFAPLIELSNTQTPLAANDEIVRQLMRHGLNTLTHHIYIHTPEDFLSFLTPDRIIDGRCETVKDGPLVNMLMDTQHLSVLVINWSNFTAAQIASYQSVIDAEPMLTVGDMSIKLSSNVIVIGLIRDANAAGKAFMSRSKRWQLDEAFFVDTYFDLQPEVSDVVEIDLHHRPTWREELFGEIVFHGKSTLLKSGALNHAIARECPLKIYNPPEDDAFTQCVHQVNGERKLLHNGGVIEIPTGVEILLAQKENAISADNIQLECESETTDQTKQRIYISINNMHELFKLLSIDKNRMADTQMGGLLEKYDPATQVIYLIGDIPLSYWQALVAYIQAHHRLNSFHILLAYGARIQGVQEEARNKELTNKPYATKPWLTENIIVSNDPDYITQQAASELNDTVIIHITIYTVFSDIIASIVHDDNDHSGFIYTEHGVLTALKNGQTVILSGEMSLTLYYQLQPLLSTDPHIQLNGERQTVSGRLMAVLPACLKKALPGLTSECTLAVEDYLPLVSTLPSFNAEHFQQILAFHQRLCKLPHRGPGRPPMPENNYQRLKMMLNALADPTAMHDHNPVKGLINFHYPRHSEDQAYINVMAKYFFSHRDTTPTRFSKLRGIIRKFNIETIQSLKSHLWKILNCYQGAELSELLGAELASIDNESRFPMVKLGLLRQLLKTCRRIAEQPDEAEQPKPMRIEKQLALLNLASKNQHTPIIFLKGEPGIGKTYTVRKLIGKYYEGEDGLLDYLMAKDNGAPIVFLWDEGNTYKPGTLNFLIKGLCSPDRIVYYKDRKFQLTPSHQLYITGNPENFPGRYFHQAILDYALVIYFDLPDDAFLMQLTSKILPAHLHTYAESILFAYHLIKKFNPFFVTSIRDVENLTHRFRFLAKDLHPNDDLAIRFALLNACTTEFSGSIRETQDRAEFITSLQKQIGVKPAQEACHLIQLTSTVSIPSQKAYIVQAIEQNLEIRLAAMMQLALTKAKVAPASLTLFTDKGKEEADAPCEPLISLKQIDILEGEPGIGKSTTLRAIVQKYKESLPQRRAQLQAKPQTRDNLIMLSVIEAEIKRSVYEISVGSADCTVVLARAAKEDAITIGDESNVDPLVEKQLIQCVSGVDEKMLPVESLAFRFLGSQNSSMHAGRMDNSHALLNRSNFIYMDKFVRQEYEMFAEAAHIPYPKQFVRAFLEICKVFPAANTRTFHQVLKMVVNEPARVVRLPDDVETVVMMEDEFYSMNDGTPLLSFRGGRH